MDTVRTKKEREGGMNGGEEKCETTQKEGGSHRRKISVDREKMSELHETLTRHTKKRNIPYRA